jgi:hypothetical protein
MDWHLELTLEDLHVIRDSLDYSVQRVSDYQHGNHSHKNDSLRPIKAARDKVRALIATSKDKPHGR